MFAAEQAPHNRRILDHQIHRYGAHRAQRANEEPHHAEAVQRKGLQHAEHVHVNVDARNERAHKVHDVRARDRIQFGQHQAGGGQRQRDPRVDADAEQQLMAPRDRVGVDDQQDALQPALALLQKVHQRERRLLVHFALDEVECVALGEGAHREEAILGHRAVEAVVEGHVPFGLYLCVCVGGDRITDKLAIGMGGRAFCGRELRAHFNAISLSLRGLGTTNKTVLLISLCARWINRCGKLDACIDYMESTFTWVTT